MSDPVRLPRPKPARRAAVVPVAVRRAEPRTRGAHEPSQTGPSSAGPSLALRAPVQAMPVVGETGDRYEQEAEAVAASVTGGGSIPTVSRLPMGGLDTHARRQDEEHGPVQALVQRQPAEDERVQQQAPRLHPRTAATIQSPGPGRPMPAAVRRRIEPRLGTGLADVQVHADAAAARAAGSLGARAFTHRNHIFLGRGESAHDVGLMAHEAAHVVQQGAASARHRAVTAAGPPVQRLVPDWVREGLSSYARHVPGWTLFTILVAFNPLTGEAVERTPMNLIGGLLGLVPFGTFLFDALRTHGILQEASTWVQGELGRANLTVGRIERTLEAAWEDVRLGEGFDYNLSVLERHFNGLHGDAATFAGSLVDHVLRMIRETAVGLVERLLAENRAWALVKKILGRDPLRGEPVEATPVEILEDFLLLIGKEQHLEQMREQGTVEKTAHWLATQLGTFTSLLGELLGLFDAAWTAIQPVNLPALTGNLQALARRVGGFLQRVRAFATTVAAEVLRIVKEALLNRLEGFAQEVPGFHLLTVFLGRNPLTGETVPRTAQALIRGFVTLLPGGAAIYRQLAETGAVERVAARIEGAVGQLGITWAFVVGLFAELWRRLGIRDLTNPVGVITRVVARFGEPISRLFAFVSVVLREMLAIILEMMQFPVDLIGSILSNVMQAMGDIKNDPVGFLVNMLRAVREGFVRFFGNILSHLAGGLTAWLFRGLRVAGIEPPVDLSLRSVLAFVLQVLGLGMERLWEKLRERIGPENVARLRRAADRLAGIWTFVRDVQDRGVEALWEHIQSKLGNLWGIVLAKVQEWVMVRIIARATQWMLSLLDPTGIMAVVNSFAAFFNAVQSAIEYLRDILAIVNDYVATIAAVARGAIEPGAQRLEQGLANAIPVAIGFLANQFGLGNIGERISQIIAGLREMIDAAIDWLIDRAVGMLQSLLRAIGIGGGEEGAAAEAAAEEAPGEEEPGEDRPEVRAVKTAALDAVRTRSQQGSFTSFAAYHRLVGEVESEFRPHGLSRLTVVADPRTLALTVSAFASVPQTTTVTWAQVFENTPVDDAALSDLLENFQTSRETYAAISVNGRLVDSASNARDHAEMELLGSPSSPSERWRDALDRAVAEGEGGSSEFVLLISRSPCGPICTPNLARWLRSNRRHYPNVRFVLAAAGNYTPTLSINELQEQLVHYLDATGRQLSVPLNELSRSDLEAILQGLNLSFQTTGIRREEATSMDNLRMLQSAGWELRQLDEGSRAQGGGPTPSARLLASRIDVVRTEAAEAFNEE